MSRHRLPFDTPRLATFERVSVTTKEAWRPISATKAALLLSSRRARCHCRQKTACWRVTESHFGGKRPVTFFPSAEIRLLSCHGGRCPGSDKVLSHDRGIKVLTDPRYSSGLSGRFNFGHQRGSGTLWTETVDAYLADKHSILEHDRVMRVGWVFPAGVRNVALNQLYRLFSTRQASFSLPGIPSVIFVDELTEAWNDPTGCWPDYAFSVFKLCHRGMSIIML